MLKNKSIKEKNKLSYYILLIIFSSVLYSEWVFARDYIDYDYYYYDSALAFTGEQIVSFFLVIGALAILFVSMLKLVKSVHEKNHNDFLCWFCIAIGCCSIIYYFTNWEALFFASLGFVGYLSLGLFLLLMGFILKVIVGLFYRPALDIPAREFLMLLCSVVGVAIGFILQIFLYLAIPMFVIYLIAKII